MSRTRQVIAALGANATTQAITIGIQLVSVPLFLSFWTQETYGKWLLLSAIPTYISLSDFGILSVATTKMTIAAAAGEINKRISIFQSAITLLTSSSTIIISLAALTLFAINPLNTDLDSRVALFLLIISALISLTNNLVDSSFRSSSRYATGIQVINLARLVEWAGMALGLFLGNTFTSVAIGNLAGRLLASSAAIAYSRREIKELAWGTTHASSHELRSMVKPALAFMAFPLGNALSIQGMTIIVGTMFGSSAVATFNVYRTLSRSAVQAVTIIGRSLWPDLSRAYGERDYQRLFSLTKKGTIYSIILAGSLGLFLFCLSKDILVIWTHNSIPFDSILFNLLLASAILTSTWQMGMVVLAATNTHSRLSSLQLIGTLGCIALTVIIAPIFDRYAAPLALILLELYFFAATRYCVGEFRSEMINVQSTLEK